MTEEAKQEQDGPVAYFDPQKGGFYWAKPTTVTAPVTVDVEPLPLYAAPPNLRERAEGLQRDYDLLFAEYKALKQEQDEPVAYISSTKQNQLVSKAQYENMEEKNRAYFDIPLYTKPQTKEWLALTDEDDIDWEEGDTLRDLFKAIEAKLKEKNT